MTLRTNYTIEALGRNNTDPISTLSDDTAIKLLEALPITDKDASQDDYDQARAKAEPFVESYFSALVKHPSPQVRKAALNQSLNYIYMSSYQPSHGPSYNGMRIVKDCMNAVEDEDASVAVVAAQLIGDFLDPQNFHPKFFKEKHAENFFSEIFENVSNAIEVIKESDSPQLKTVLLGQMDTMLVGVRHAQSLDILQNSPHLIEGRLLAWALHEPDEQVVKAAIDFLIEREKTAPEAVYKFVDQLIGSGGNLLYQLANSSNDFSTQARLHSNLSQLNVYKAIQESTSRDVDELVAQLS